MHDRIGDHLVIMSAKELEIRRELEMDVEKELAAEIKDEICSLSLRLIRLYQQQKEREDKAFSQFGKKIQLAEPKTKALAEVNINIKMEGGREVQIEEGMKNVRKTCRKPKISSEVETNVPKTSNFSEKNARQRILSDSRKKFDWVKTLRSGTSNAVSHQQKEPEKTARVWNDNVQVVGNGTKCMAQRR